MPTVGGGAWLRDSVRLIFEATRAAGRARGVGRERSRERSRGGIPSIPAAVYAVHAQAADLKWGHAGAAPESGEGSEELQLRRAALRSALSGDPESWANFGARASPGGAPPWYDRSGDPGAALARGVACLGPRAAAWRRLLQLDQAPPALEKAIGGASGVGSSPRGNRKRRN